MTCEYTTRGDYCRSGRVQRPEGEYGRMAVYNPPHTSSTGGLVYHGQTEIARGARIL